MRKLDVQVVDYLTTDEIKEAVVFLKLSSPSAANITVRCRCWGKPSAKLRSAKL